MMQKMISFCKRMFCGALAVISLIGFATFSLSGVVASEPPKESAALVGGKGIGPVQDLKLGTLDIELAKKGKALYTTKCSACHKMTERYVGPELGGIFKRRKPEWIANMILNPMEMLEKDPIGQELLAEYVTQMADQNLTQEETFSVMEYMRYYGEKGELSEPPKVEGKGAPISGKKTKKGK